MYIESHTTIRDLGVVTYNFTSSYLPLPPSVLVLSLTLLMIILQWTYLDTVRLEMIAEEVKIVSRCKAVKEPLTLCKSLAPIKCSEF